MVDTEQLKNLIAKTEKFVCRNPIRAAIFDFVFGPPGVEVPGWGEIVVDEYFSRSIQNLTRSEPLSFALSEGSVRKTLATIEDLCPYTSRSYNDRLGVPQTFDFRTLTHVGSRRQFIASGGTMSKRAAIYSRVSVKHQDTENQLQELQRVAERQGWEIVHIYTDHGISGAKGRDQRPELDRMLKDAVRREFDVIMAWSVDRLGRSLQHLVGFLDEIHSKNVHLYLHQQGVDTTTPAGKALFQMTGVFAEFERSMISERVKAGLARTKSEGTRLGRPSIPKSKERAILRAKSEGKGVKAIAKELGIGVSPVQRVIREHT